jgi:hypothetical protein
VSHPFNLSIDWSGDGVFVGVGEDVTAAARASFGISCSRGKDQIRQFSPPAAGGMSAKLDNIARDYSPGNTGSALYGNLAPGKKERLSTIAGSSGSLSLVRGGHLLLVGGGTLALQPTPVRNVWTGILDDLIQHPEREEKSVEVPALGPLSRLRDKSITTALYRDIRTDEALGYLLDAAGWPVDERSLQVGSVTLDWWWLDNQDAFDAMVELVITEGEAAAVYEDGSGNFVFENNTARMTQTRSTVSQAAYSDDTNIAFSYNPNFKNVILACRVTQQEREPAALDVIWTYEGTVTLAANASRKFEIRGGEIFLGALEPSPVGRNEEQVLTASDVLTSGTWIANVNGTDTTAIAFGATAATIQTAFETAAGAGNVQCGGALAAGLRVQFCGDLAFKAIPLITITSSLNAGVAPATINAIDITDGTDTTWRLYASAVLSAGTFRIKNYLGNETADLGYNATALQIQNAIELEPVIAPGDVPATGGPVNTTEVIVPFSGTISGNSVPLSITHASSLRTSTGATATILVTETVKGGGPDYVLASGSVTFTFDRDNGPSATVTVTAGAFGAVLTDRWQVRARPVPVVRTNQVSYPETTTLPDGQIFKPSIRNEIPLATAQAFVLAVWTHYYAPRPTVEITVLKDIRDFAAVDSSLKREISDRITASNAQIGTSEDYFIEQIRHTIEPANYLLRSTFGCEKAM